MRTSLAQVTLGAVLALGTGCMPPPPTLPPTSPAPTTSGAAPSAPEASASVPSTEAPGTAAPAGEGAAATPSGALTVYFPDQQHPDFAHTCGAVTAVERRMAGGASSPEVVLRALFAGPSSDERARGLIDPYAADAVQPPVAERLGAHLRGVQLEGSRAVVDFAAPALHWLNAAACQQEAVKVPIERTLREHFGVERVDYAIDGKLFTDWDA